MHPPRIFEVNSRVYRSIATNFLYLPYTLPFMKGVGIAPLGADIAQAVPG